jgi:hypothetical protein
MNFIIHIGYKGQVAIIPGKGKKFVVTEKNTGGASSQNLTPFILDNIIWDLWVPLISNFHSILLSLESNLHSFAAIKTDQITLPRNGIYNFLKKIK